VFTAADDNISDRLINFAIYTPTLDAKEYPPSLSRLLRTWSAYDEAVIQIFFLLFAQESGGRCGGAVEPEAFGMLWLLSK
jgi:hypothetical protein